MKSFQEIGLHDGILKALKDLGYENPTQIQETAIPKILAGHDLQASAQTGTGKTAAFLLPALHRLSVPSPVKVMGPRILILVPTRELAMQVAAEATKYSKYLSKVKTVCVYGGVSYPKQNQELSRHYEILVATPGRLIDHIERGRINFSRLEMLVLDEADRMLDMGFIQPVKEIAALVPKDRQTLLFSATFKESVINLSRCLLNNPVEVHVTPEQVSHDNINQSLHFVDNIDHKHRVLDHVLNDPEMNQVIIFTAQKRYADKLATQLYSRGYQAAALHGDMKQHHRTRTLKDLRQGTINVLVATDVATRGIDVKTITHVINFDLPRDVEDYVHRIGRTGRAGAKGTALSFVGADELHLVKQIEKFTGQKIASQVIPGLESTFDPNNIKPKPKKGNLRGRGFKRKSNFRR